MPLSSATIHYNPPGTREEGLPRYNVDMTTATGDIDAIMEQASEALLLLFALPLRSYDIL